MALKPLLMMRTRGLYGPHFSKFMNSTKLVKSIGNAYSPGGALSIQYWLEEASGDPWDSEISGFWKSEVSS